MDSKHTNEPWVLREDPSDIERLIHGGDGWICRVMLRGEGRDSEVLANAIRIVACVNACAGVQDPVLEMARLRSVEQEYIALCKVYSSWLVSRNKAIEALSTAGLSA